MKVEIDLPEDTLRKLKALNILIGGSDDIETALVKMLDAAIVSKIVETVVEGNLGKAVTSHITHAQSKAFAPEGSEFHDLTGVSDGLGDDEPAPAPKRRKQGKRQAPPPEARIESLASDDALDHEMDVDDPEHEAKVAAPTFADQMVAPTPEEAFSLASGMPPPTVDISPRRGRARIDKKHVSPFTGSEQERI